MFQPKINTRFLAILFLAFIYLALLLGVVINGVETMRFFPIVLLVSCFVVGCFHPVIDGRFAAYTTIVYVSSFVVEVIGVKTGAIFGQFFYGNNLGVTLFETPLIIGILWLLLSYCSAVFISMFSAKLPMLNTTILKALLSSFISVITIVLLENIAAASDFWYWKHQAAPVQNYTAWFAFSFAFNFLYQKLVVVDSTNTVSIGFLFILLTFLLTLNLLPIV